MPKMRYNTHTQSLYSLNFSLKLITASPFKDYNVSENRKRRSQWQKEERDSSCGLIYWGWTENGNTRVDSGDIHWRAAEEKGEEKYCVDISLLLMKIFNMLNVFGIFSSTERSPLI